MDGWMCNQWFPKRTPHEKKLKMIEHSIFFLLKTNLKIPCFSSTYTIQTYCKCQISHIIQCWLLVLCVTYVASSHHKILLNHCKKKSKAGASTASERAAQSLNNSGLASRIRQRRLWSILEALLKYGTDVSYFEQTNSMLNQTPNAFYEPMKHKPIYLLNHNATSYRGIKQMIAYGHLKCFATTVTMTKILSQTGSPHGDWSFLQRSGKF